MDVERDASTFVASRVNMYAQMSVYRLAEAVWRRWLDKRFNERLTANRTAVFEVVVVFDVLVMLCCIAEMGGYTCWPPLHDSSKSEGLNVL